MNYLAVDTSAEYLTVVACKNGKETVYFEKDCAMRHSERLMGAIEETLSKAELSPKDCDFFCAVTGPGSFTGIRIGISTIKGFCSALEKPAFAVTSFRTLAYNAIDKTLSVIPAGRGYFYVCGFDEKGEEILAPEYASSDRLAELAEQFKLRSFTDLPVPFERADPAKGLCIAAAGFTGATPLGALYVRKSQAEEEREKRERQ